MPFDFNALMGQFLQGGGGQQLGGLIGGGPQPGMGANSAMGPQLQHMGMVANSILSDPVSASAKLAAQAAPPTGGAGVLSGGMGNVQLAGGAGADRLGAPPAVPPVAQVQVPPSQNPMDAMTQPQQPGPDLSQILNQAGAGLAVMGAGQQQPQQQPLRPPAPVAPRGGNPAGAGNPQLQAMLLQQLLGQQQGGGIPGGMNLGALIQGA